MGKRRRFDGGFTLCDDLKTSDVELGKNVSPFLFAAAQALFCLFLPRMSERFWIVIDSQKKSLVVETLYLSLSSQVPFHRSHFYNVICIHFGGGAVMELSLFVFVLELV